MQNVPCFRSQEAKHQNEEMKKKKEQEERKAQALAEVKLWFIWEPFLAKRDENDVTERGAHVCALSQRSRSREFSFL